MNASIIGDNILARLTRCSIGTALNVGFTLDSSLIKTNDATKQRDYFGPVNIKKLHIKLINKFCGLVNMPNSNYSLTFQFEKL